MNTYLLCGLEMSYICPVIYSSSDYVWFSWYTQCEHVISHENRLLRWPIPTFLWFGIRASSYQCNQVPGVLAAKVSTAAEDDQSHEEDCIGHIVCPRITSHKVLGIIDKGEDGDEGESDQQLHCENHEDLEGIKLYYMLYWLFYQIHSIWLTQ